MTETPLPTPEQRQMDPSRFGAAHAIIAFALMMFAQFAAGFAVLITAIVVEAARGANIADQQYMNALTERLMVPLLIVGIVATIVTTLLVVRVWAWHLVRDRTRTGLGLVWPPRAQLLLWIAIGLLLGLAYMTLTKLVPTEWTGGPLAKIAASGGIGRAVWAVVAIAIAPPLEELLFRGLILRGFLASWGVTWASVATTVLFFIPHVFETGTYWPAILAILAIGAATLAGRLLTGSVYAAMAVHLAYNASLVVAVYASG